MVNLKLSDSSAVTSPLPLSIGNSSSPLFLYDKSVPNIPPWQWKQSPPVKLLKEENPAFSSGVKFLEFIMLKR